MSKTDHAKCSILSVIIFLFIFIHCCTSAPVNVSTDLYTQLVAELNHNQCSVPSQVQLPFDTSDRVDNFEYLSPNLEICQQSESTKRNKEAFVLCKEIFDNIKSISCATKTALPDISVPLSENVCQDIGVLKDSVPEDDKSLLKRLTDGFLCDIMCDSEFQKACQVLLWSFEVQKQIATDSLKQENALDAGGVPETNAELESDKKDAEKAKDAGKVGLPGDSTKVEKLENTLGKNLFIPSGKPMQGKPVLNDKEHTLEVKTIPRAKNQDEITTTQSTYNGKTPSTVSQQVSEAQSSNTGVKPVGGTTEDKVDAQDANTPPQGDLTNQAYVEGGLQGSNTNADEQTGIGYSKKLADAKVQGQKDASLPANSSINAAQSIHAAGEDNVPANNIPGEADEKGDTNSNFVNNNNLPRESAKVPIDAVVDLHDNEPNSSNLVTTRAQNNPPITARDDIDLTNKINTTSTKSQTLIDATQQQIVQETNQDKTGVTKVETKGDQPQTNSVSLKVGDHAKTDDGTKSPSTDQKKPQVSQKNEEFDNTIPDAAGESINIDDKPLEKSEISKPTTMSPDGKSVVPSSVAETSTKTTAVLEKMEGGGEERPVDQEENHYGDPENTDGDEYPGGDYDGSFGEASKTKASNPDVPSAIPAAEEIVPSQNERPMEFPSRNGFGQEASDIQLISSFPEQEDSHFFFYFLSMVLILMAGYLIFHNKQKIIALIVEGRHERNRRSHRIGYKKLETK